MEQAYEIFKNLQQSVHIKKSYKNELTDIMNTINNTDLKKIIKKIIDSKIYTKFIKTEVDTFMKKHPIKEKINENTEIVIINDLTLENTLDSKCDRYNKFTENNPAEHISYNKSKNSYVLVYNKKENTSKDLSKLIIMLKEKLVRENSKLFLKNMSQNIFQYKDKKIIVYFHDNKPYFDINHIVNLFDDIKSNDAKYYEYKNSIECYSMHDNNVGGFYIKEYISQETFFKMLLHTNSIFSNKFKDDVAKLLDKLSNNGNLMIKDDEIKLVDNKITNADILKIEYEYTQTYDNIYLINYIKEEIRRFKKVNILKYHNIHIMYFCIVALTDPDNKNRILCKIGYTCDIIERIKTLSNEYKTTIYMLCLKTITKEQDEKEFHKIIRTKYPELIVNIKINNTEKTEIYIFDIEIYKLFLTYPDKVKFSEEIIALEEDVLKLIDKYMNNIDIYFEQYMMSMTLKLVQYDMINEHQKDYMIYMTDIHYKLLSKKNDTCLYMIKCHHEKDMKEKEFEYNMKLKEKEIEIENIKKEKEIEILKLQCELQRLKNNSDVS